VHVSDSLPTLSATLALTPVRLATTCREDSPTAIADAVRELVAVFHTRNQCTPSSVRIALFTATSDLRTVKPAAAARLAGWADAQFLCLAEMPTDDDLSRCLRVLLLVERAPGAPPLRPVYLNGAQSLRPDLATG
jgi:chorismate mutase